VLAESRAAAIARYPDLQTFAARVAPSMVWYRHVRILSDVLEAVARGERTRVLISVPPPPIFMRTRPASLSTRSVSGNTRRMWSRLASSGTTPP
jgi:hypothetical protein